MQKILKILMVMALALVFCASSALAGDINGAGSTFIYPVLVKWIDSYKTAKGVAINYQGIGSGGGLKELADKTVDFAGSDMPLKPEELAKEGYLQFPAIVGGIVPCVHIQGIKPGELVLNGDVLAKIYMGDIKKWNDPAITKLNPGIKLPNAAITTIHRSDGSGTTFNFANYLSKVNEKWQKQLGFNTVIAWVGGLGGKGNAGVATYIQQIPNSIGYVEYAYAIQNHLAYTKMINKDGQTVSPSLDAFAASAANAKWDPKQGFFLILTDSAGKTSWPITASTFVLMPQKPTNADNAKTVLEFFSWVFKNGQPAAKQLDYVALPESVASQIEGYWKTAAKL